MKDVVVLLPGIMGSALKMDADTPWDVSTGMVGQMIWTRGGRLMDLALRSDASTGEGVTATHVLGDVHLIPFFWEIRRLLWLVTFHPG